jgi:hypothetical protein
MHTKFLVRKPLARPRRRLNDIKCILEKYAVRMGAGWN